MNSSGFTRLLIPLVLTIAAFRFLGPVVGFVVVAILSVGIFFLNRAALIQNRASKKYHSGDFEGALNDMKIAVSQDPKSAKIRSTYAYLLLKLGHTDEAAVQMDEALKLVQQEADKNAMKVTKSLVLWKQGRLDEAIEILEELIKTYENTNVYATLGFLYIEKGDYNKALEFNLQAKDFNSTNAIILDNLGTTYMLLNDYDKALETYVEAIKQKPNFPEAYYNYAKVLEHKGDIEKALYMVRHALTLRFWNTSTVRKEDVEAYLQVLEEKEKSMEPKKPLEIDEADEINAAIASDDSIASSDSTESNESTELNKADNA